MDDECTTKCQKLAWHSVYRERVRGYREQETCCSETRIQTGVSEGNLMNPFEGTSIMGSERGWDGGGGGRSSFRFYHPVSLSLYIQSLQQQKQTHKCCRVLLVRLWSMFHPWTSRFQIIQPDTGQFCSLNAATPEEKLEAICS